MYYSQKLTLNIDNCDVVTYTTVKIPDPLLDEVENTIQKNPQFGYRNRSEFIVEAIREKITEIKKLPK